MFKPSRYNIFVPLRNGRRLAYNSLSGGFGLWEAEESALYQRIEAGEAIDSLDPSVGEMVQAGYLVSGAMDELRVMEQAYRAHRFDPGSMILTIAPTMACNFGCDYCFQGQDKPSGSMTQEVEDAIVAYVEREAAGGRSLHVAWYGGEPLGRREIIERLSDRLIECATLQRITYSAMMVTNGFLLSADVARSLWERRVKTIQVTLDGAPEDHDKRRTLLSGKPTFDRIAQNLLAAVEATPITFSIRVNIDRRNADRIVELLDLLSHYGLGNRRSFQVYFAPVEAITTGCHNVTDDCLGKREYGELEARLYRYAFEKGLSSLPYPPRFRGTCGAVRPQGFVILPTGEIHKCWDTVNTPGRAVGTIFDMAAAKRSTEALRFTRWSPLDNESCRACRILPSCAGACAYKFLYAEDTRGEQAVLPCPSWKYNIKERLVLRAEKTGAIGPDEYDREAIRTDPAELCTEMGASDAALHAKKRAASAARRVRLPVVSF